MLVLVLLLFKAQAQAKACSFLPPHYTHTHAYSPLYPPRTRSIRMRMQGKAQLQKMRAYVEAHSADGCTFAPTVTKKAAALHRPGSAAERLYNPEWVRSRKAEERK